MGPDGTLFPVEASRPVNLCKPSPCMNEGTCVLRNGSYLCTCRDGWGGPHCENREWGSCSAGVSWGWYSETSQALGTQPKAGSGVLAQQKGPQHHLFIHAGNV